MALLKGIWSLTRFRMDGDLPAKFNEFIDSGLKKYAFSGFIAANADKTMGWTNLENVLDTDFTYARYNCGPYLIFSLRVDRITIPASLVKLKVMEAEKQYLAEREQKRLYRHERETIKEKVQLELRSKALNIPSFFEVCWLPEKNSLMFGSLATSAIEDFEKYFKESFHLTLRSFLPWECGTAASLATDASAGSTGQLVKTTPPPEKSAAAPPCWGREFLTWLWFKSEERNGAITLPERTEVEIIFLQRLVLASGEGEYSETVVCQGLHSDMKEGREALRQGKKIKEARIRLSQDATRWEFTFKADFFQFQSLKLPVTDSEEEEDREGQNLERIYLIEKAVETMERLFALYSRLRNSPQWENEEMPRFQKWLNQIS